MNGQMMQMPLLTSSLLVHAERHHADQQIVSRRVEGDIHRCTYADLAVRTRKLANAVAALGVAVCVTAARLVSAISVACLTAF